MAGSTVLDTNIAVPFLSGDIAIRRKVAAATEILVPTVVLGELFYGAQQSERLAENLDRIASFATSVKIQYVTYESAQLYGVIKTALRKNGTPIPDNDIWIAAIALQFDAQLATRDGHFRHIDNLRIVMW